MFWGYLYIQPAHSCECDTHIPLFSLNLVQRLKDQFITYLWSKVKGHCDFTKHIFGHNSRMKHEVKKGSNDEVLTFDNKKVKG